MTMKSNLTPPPIHNSWQAIRAKYSYICHHLPSPSTVTSAMSESLVLCGALMLTPQHFCIAVRSHWSQEGHATVLIVYPREGLLPAATLQCVSPSVLYFHLEMCCCYMYRTIPARRLCMDGWKHILVYGVYGVWMAGSICPLCSTCSVAALFCSISTVYGLKLISYGNTIL